MKKITIILLFIPTSIILIGLTRYHLALNEFISQESEAVRSERNAPSDGTKIYIVGTVHFETDAIKKQDLYNYLDSLAPSVILFEGDAGTVKRIAKKTDYFARFVDGIKGHNRVEKPVVLKYLNKNPECVLLPYEWELRDKFHRKHRFRKRSKKFINAVLNMYYEKIPTNTSAEMVANFLALNEKIQALDSTGTITDINSSTVDSLLELRQTYIYRDIPALARNNEALSAYADFYRIHMNYWDTRNKAMAQNILKQIQRHPKKVMVVLTGFYHRYYLINELQSYQTEFNFSINPY